MIDIVGEFGQGIVIIGVVSAFATRGSRFKSLHLHQGIDKRIRMLRWKDDILIFFCRHFSESRDC